MMIPKKIHYCWFGGNKKGELIENCIKSWHEKCPEYEIIEWNEQTIDLSKFSFAERMFAKKKWAFVADYVRFFVLEQYGGWYLDTDIELLRSLDEISDHQLVLGEETPGQISAGMIGAVPQHPYMKECLKYYDNAGADVLVTSPKVMNDIYNGYVDKQSILVLPPIAFYPYSQETIRYLDKSKLTEDTIGIHFWNYSWGNPVLKVLNKTAFYRSLKRTLERMKIKKFIKGIMGLPQT